MKAFVLTREAKQDLRKIAIFTEMRWGREQRYLYIKQFDDGFHFSAESPSIEKSVITSNQVTKSFLREVILFFIAKAQKVKLLLFEFFIKIWMLSLSFYSHNGRNHWEI